MSVLLAPFRSRSFRLLWAGSTVSLLGDGLFYVAIGWQTLALSNAATALSLVWLAFTLPHLLALLAGGVLTDRLPRREVLLGANLVSGAALAITGSLALTGSLRLWELFALVGVYGTAEAVFGPAYAAIVPELVEPEVLVQANSLNQLNRPLALRLVGPALGGLVVARASAGLALSIDAATFFVSAACLASMQVPQRAAAAAGRGLQAVLREVGEGFAAVRRVPWLWAGMGADAIGTVVTWGCVQALVPGVVKNDLGGGAQTLGLVFAAGGVGSIVSALAVGRRGLPRRPAVVLFWILGAKAAAVAIFGLARSPATAMLASLLMSGLATAGLVIWTTMLHERVSGDLLGRVNSIDWLVSTSLMPVALVALGPLADSFGAQRVLLTAGLGGGLLTLVFLLVSGVAAADRRHTRDAQQPASDVRPV